MLLHTIWLTLTSGVFFQKISNAKIQVDRITHKPIIQVFWSPVVILEVNVKQDTPCQLTF